MIFIAFIDMAQEACMIYYICTEVNSYITESNSVRLFFDILHTLVLSTHFNLLARYTEMSKRLLVLEFFIILMLKKIEYYQPLFLNIMILF